MSITRIYLHAPHHSGARRKSNNTIHLTDTRQDHFDPPVIDCGFHCPQSDSSPWRLLAYYFDFRVPARSFDSTSARISW
jgi:hypothetical protein